MLTAGSLSLWHDATGTRYDLFKCHGGTMNHDLSGVVESVLAKVAPKGGGSDGMVCGPLGIESWPFTIKVVQTDEQLAKVLRLRHDAYARHLPAFASALLHPEPADFRDTVLIAESKLDGAALGTIRVSINRDAPLAVESNVVVPQDMDGARLAEATRLAIQSNSRLVREALFKAFYDVCVRNDVDFMFIAARSPLDRMYLALMFEDLAEGGMFVPLSYAAGIPHRIMRLDLRSVRARWKDSAHPLYRFVFDTVHPDLKIEAVDTSESVVPSPAISPAD